MVVPNQRDMFDEGHGVSATRILVVEDDSCILELVTKTFGHAGYECAGAATGAQALELLTNDRFDLLVLDVMLPDTNGLEVCSTARRVLGDIPIIMLTSRAEEEDVLRGFEHGADDYVAKPFRKAELIARAKALLRRANRTPPDETTPFLFGPWHVDPRVGRASTDHTEVLLSLRECALLRLLVRDKGAVISRAKLLREVWGFAEPDKLSTRRVDVHIAKLRSKLDAESGKTLIETIHGEGYRYSGW